AAAVSSQLAEPADTAALRGRQRRAKTDRADSRHLRQLLADGRLPECYIPPSAVLEWRGCWSGGRCWSCITTCARSTPGGHSASRPPVSIRAPPHSGRPGVIRGDRQLLAAIVEDQLSPVGRLQVNTAL